MRITIRTYKTFNKTFNKALQPENLLAGLSVMAYSSEVSHPFFYAELEQFQSCFPRELGKKRFG